MHTDDDREKAMFTGGLLLGLVFGVIGNLLVTLLFRVVDGAANTFEFWAFVVAAIGFSMFVFVLMNRLKKLPESSRKI